MLLHFDKLVKRLRLVDAAQVRAIRIILDGEIVTDTLDGRKELNYYIIDTLYFCRSVLHEDFRRRLAEGFKARSFIRKIVCQDAE